MSETVERNNRFYEQPNGKILTENEQLKEWLVIANKHNDELQKERDMYKGSFEIMSENYFKLENIIKEVREKIHDIWFKIDFTNMTSMSYVTIKLDETSQGNELLEILDKEDKNGDNK